jgi:hypothetical protein
VATTAAVRTPTAARPTIDDALFMATRPFDEFHWIARSVTLTSIEMFRQQGRNKKAHEALR